jgi:hypothetical protein
VDVLLKPYVWGEIINRMKQALRAPAKVFKHSVYLEKKPGEDGSEKKIKLGKGKSL